LFFKRVHHDGSVMVIAVDMPISLFTEISPLCFSIIVFTIDSPNPLPPEALERD
jgi:hypothetical protein